MITKNKTLNKYSALLMTALLVLTGCSSPLNNALEPSEIEALMKEATIGELADFFIKAADDYNPDVNRSDLLEGFDEMEIANRLQMFVLASRAFGELSEPSEGMKRIAPLNFELTQVPDWALKDMNNLLAGGILDASDLGFSQENGNENTKFDEMLTAVSMKDAVILTSRFYMMHGTNLKDDFYTAVNSNAFDNTYVGPGEVTGGSAEVSDNTNRQLHELILEIVNSNEVYPQGSSKQKIKTLYLNVLNAEERREKGIAPLEKYLAAVTSATNYSELNAAIAMAVNELGNSGNGLFPMVPVTDTKDSTRYIMQLLTMMPMLSAEDYDNLESEPRKEYRKSLIEQLLLVGESEQNAEKLANQILALEKALLLNMTDYSTLSELSQTKVYTPKLLDEMIPQAKFSELFIAIGLSDDTPMQVFDDKQFAEYAQWFTQENLELFKAIQKINLLGGFSKYLSPELAVKYGYETTDLEEAANMAVQSFLSDELSQLYVERYFPQESKAEIEKMATMMIDVLKERIQRLDWMEEGTKQEALRKLDSLTVLIGYPDTWEFNPANFRSSDEGGSYFENFIASEAIKWKNITKKINQPVDQRKFPLAAYTVNAAANRNTNTLIFPAGILQAPLYDRNASFEANLGAIGTTIAHEITHLFDDGGAQYDADGNLRNWWGESDYEHFQLLCKQVEEAYDGREAAPGIKINGKETLSENIADIGGVACALEVLSKMENPDYDAFFRSYAKYWQRIADRETLAEMAASDEHAPNNLRCNIVLSNFQEFYDTYDIKETDGMYVSPEHRIKIW